MYPFDYHRAQSVEDAKAALGDDEEAKLLAGGMTLLPTLKQRLAIPTKLVDLNEIPGLGGIVRQSASLRIGAMARHADVMESSDVAELIPALTDLAALIGDPHVRHRGTLGGSLANADPAADYPAAVLALGAQIVTDQRTIDGDAFFTGLFETALAPGEIILAVEFPVPVRAGYAKFANPASRYAIVGVFVAQSENGVRVGVTGAGPNAFRWDEAEAALDANFDPDALSDLAYPADGLNADMHASAEYRAHLIGVMARRATAAAQG